MTTSTFLTPDPTTLEIRNAAGDVVITLADVGTTRVEVTAVPSAGFGFLDKFLPRTFGWDPQRATPDGDDPIDPAELVRVEERDGAILIDTDPAKQGWRTAFRVEITAPVGSGVRTQTQSAGVRVTGTAGRLEIKTASGDVVADQVLGGVLAHSASGDLSLVGVGGDLDARSASGDIVVGFVGGAAKVNSTSGDVRLDAPSGSVDARSVSGDIALRDVVRGTVQATAVSGDIEIGVHRGSLAAISLTTVSGDTRSDFEVSDQPLPPAPPTAPDPPTPPAGPAGPVGQVPAGLDLTKTLDNVTRAVDEAVEDALRTMIDETADTVTGGPPAASDTGGSAAVLEIRAKTTSGDIRLRRAVPV